MKIDAIIQAIKDYDQIIIHRHVRPDPDAYGSQVGLKEMIKASFPQKEVYAVGAEDPSLDFLARMDKVEDEQFSEALKNLRMDLRLELHIPLFEIGRAHV